MSGVEAASNIISIITIMSRLHFYIAHFISREPYLSRHDYNTPDRPWTSYSDAWGDRETSPRTDSKGGRGYKEILAESRLGSWARLEEAWEKQKRRLNAAMNRIRISGYGPACDATVRHEVEQLQGEIEELQRVIKVLDDGLLLRRSVGYVLVDRSILGGFDPAHSLPLRHRFIYCGIFALICAKLIAGSMFLLHAPNVQYSGQRPPRKWLTVASVAALVAAFISALVMTAYDSSDGTRIYRGMRASAIFSAFGFVFTKLHLEAHLPAFLANPTPAVFLVACCTYAISLLTFHILHSDDKDQAKFFAAGVALPFPVGLLCGADLRSIAVKVLPWSVIISLIVSAAYHSCYRPLRKELDEEEQVMWLGAKCRFHCQHLRCDRCSKDGFHEKEVGGDELEKKERLIENDSGDHHKNDDDQGEQHNEKRPSLMAEL